MLLRYCQIIALFLLPVSVAAQSLSITVDDNGSSGSTSAFSLAEGQVSLSDSQIRFLDTGNTVSGFLDYGLSPDLSVVALIQGAGQSSRALVLDSRGDTLAGYDITSLSAGDPSLAVYPSNTGAVLVRDNIASFSFYDTFGEIISRVSSSSQSTQGEAISEVAMDPQAKTIVIYNPQIKRDGAIGSQARVLNASNKLDFLYSDPKRMMKDVEVSADGKFIALLTGDENLDDQVVIIDKYGNELNSMVVDEELKGARFTGDAAYITLYSDGRVMVFNTLSGERKGSASLRAPVIVADYFPEDDVIVAITGNRSLGSNVVRDVGVHAIHIGQREIVQEDFSAPVGMYKADRLRLNRTASNRYRLEGASLPLVIRTSF